MDVQDRLKISDTHSIEWGKASWDDKEKSIRNRYDTESGRFTPHNASEIPFGDLERLVVESAKRDHISSQMAARMIEELAASISRQGDGSPTATGGEPTFEPWVGDNYEEGIEDGIQLLILGESHYGTSESDDASFTQRVVATHGQENRHAFFTKTAKLVLGLTGEDHLSDEQSHQFWERVAFYNYVQEYVGETPDGTVDPEMWEGAKKPLLTVLDRLNPDALLVLGKGTGNHLPDEISDRDLNTCIVTHPSSPRFSYTNNQPNVRSMLVEG
ncbi:hypothetical protein [Salinibacter sp.]|uniref:hypothetical protein n=1 Tax=Salinibacter sp. TaxID=2065818 RepID=UPI0021E948F1|nr:hypothetical protein [Salinibacter sp.]